MSSVSLFLCVVRLSPLMQVDGNEPRRPYFTAHCVVVGVNFRRLDRPLSVTGSRSETMLCPCLLLNIS